MTSKLDTAGLVERLRTVSNMINMGEKIGWGEETALMDQAADLIEALTAQAPAPDMEPVAWRGDHQVDYTRKFTAIKRVSEIWGAQGLNVEPLYSATQLSAVQRERDEFRGSLATASGKLLLADQRAEVAQTRVEQLENSSEWQRPTTAPEAAEARVAELEGRSDENGFVIGHPVEKFTGEARWEGTLVASYLTTAGKRRYVVEVHPQGFQMIAVPAQLRMIAALTDEGAAALAHKGEGR